MLVAYFLNQLQCPHDELVVVGGPELQSLDQADQTAPVVAGVGGPELHPPALLVGGAAGLVLEQQLQQHLHTARGGVDDLAHGLLG